mgnify:CR=1 FL=1
MRTPMTDRTPREVIGNFPFGTQAVGVEWADHLQEALTAAGYEIVLKGVVAKEREACAMIAASHVHRFNGLQIAAAIRARGKE